MIGTAILLPSLRGAPVILQKALEGKDDEARGFSVKRMYKAKLAA